MTVASNLDKLRCARRELALRLRVYPARIAAGAMTDAKAKHEIGTMEAIVADYQRLVVDDAEKGRLL